MNWPAIALGTAALWLIGVFWYGLLFARRWQAETGVTEAPAPRAVARIMALTLLLELVVVMTLGHLFQSTMPSDRAKMMIAIGFGLGIMSPAIGINYLHQRRSLRLFLIDAGHCVAGMAGVGAVFVWLG